MKYLFEGEQLNPERVADELGLSPLEVAEVKITSTGAVEIDIPGDVTEDPVKKQKLADLLAKHSLPRGKKPRP